MGRKVIHRDEALVALLKQSASQNRAEKLEAMDKLAKMAADEMNVRLGFALDVNPDQEIQKPVMPGDIYSDIFETIMLAPDEHPMFPMGIVAPGTEDDYAAYTMPSHGYIPQRKVEGDEVTIQTYDVANAIDWNIKYARAGRVDVVGQALAAMQNGFVQKFNDDAWHTIIAAGYGRGLITYDSSATAGVFSKKLIQLMKIAMKRNGGGNSSSINTFNLTDLYVSPEGMQDILSWTDSDVSELTRRDLELNAEGTISRIFGVNIHELTELGEGQKYTKYYTDTLSGSFGEGTDVELVVGIDRTKDNVFKMPMRTAGVEIYPDETRLRSREQGYFSIAEVGFGVLDSRSILLGSF